MAGTRAHEPEKKRAVGDAARGPKGSETEKVEASSADVHVIRRSLFYMSQRLHLNLN